MFFLRKFYQHMADASHKTLLHDLFVEFISQLTCLSNLKETAPNVTVL